MAKVLNALVAVIAVLLAIQGFKAGVNPHAWLAEYQFSGAGPKGLSEVRCFFGGNFTAWVVMLGLGFVRPDLRRGTWYSAAIALSLVALLRGVSIALDGAVDFNAFAMVMELLFAAIIAGAARMTPKAA